jgi:competence protein ComEA
MKDRRGRVPGHPLALLAALGLLLAGLPAAAEDARLTGVVNINTASVEELQLLPGIGEARARAVVALREKRGGFKRVDELLDVKGIGEPSLARLRPHLAVEGKTTARLE